MSLLAAACRYLWKTQVLQPDPFNRWAPILTSPGWLCNNGNTVLWMCSLGLTVSVNPPKLPPTENTQSPLPVSVDMGWGSLHGTKAPGSEEGGSSRVGISVWSVSCDRSHARGLSPSTYQPLLLDSMKHLLYPLVLNFHVSKDSVDCSGWLLDVQLKIWIGGRSKWTRFYLLCHHLQSF